MFVFVLIMDYDHLSFGFFLAVVLLFFVLLFLSSCVTYSDCQCSSTLAPVMCINGNVMRNFTNPCFAQCNGFSRCFGIAPEKNLSFNSSENLCNCTSVFSPVICTGNKTKEDFVNRCVANCNGFYNCLSAVY